MVTRRYVFLLLLTGMFCLLTLFPTSTYIEASKTHQQIPESQKLYINPEYHFQLAYPAHWTKIKGIYEERYGANDGFFQFTAAGTGLTKIDGISKQLMLHKLQPYGSKPRSCAMMIAGQPARLILPSQDQAPFLNRQAALLVHYPKPVKIGGTSYAYLLLWADEEHIYDLAQNIRFMPQVEKGNHSKKTDGR